MRFPLPLPQLALGLLSPLLLLLLVVVVVVSSGLVVMRGRGGVPRAWE